MEVDRRDLAAGLGGQEQGGAAGAAAEVEHARALGQRPHEGEEAQGGGVGAGALPGKPVVQGEEGVTYDVVCQRFEPLGVRAPPTRTPTTERGRGRVSRWPG